MDPRFRLSDDQAALVDATRELARGVLEPLVRAGTPGRVNRPLVRALGEHGLIGRIFGPGGVTALELCLLREAVAIASVEAETALAVQGLGAHPIAAGAQPEVRERWIPAVVAGDAVAAFALSEAGAGSDAGALTLAAEPDGDGWRLVGAKKWISNAPDADVYTVFARTTPGSGARGVTAFAVAGDAAGLSGRSLELIAEHPVGELAFDGVRVERTDVIGEVDAGFRVAMRTLDLFRPSVGAFGVGMAQAALEAALDHTGRRETFGRPLREHQAVAHHLADMATRTVAARLLVHAAAEAYDRLAAMGAGARPRAGAADGRAEAGGDPWHEVTRLSAMAKLFATETAQEVVDTAVQLHGAVALEKGHLLASLYREVRAPRIYEGASDIQRTVIARRL